MSSVPPPPLPPMPPMQPRKSRARIIGAIVVVLILVGAAGTSFVILAPKLSLVDFSHADSPERVVSTSTYQYSFEVIVANSGYLSGRVTIVCSVSFEFTPVNGTPSLKTFEGVLEEEVAGGHQTAFEVQVQLPYPYGIFSMLANKTWGARLA